MPESEGGRMGSGGSLAPAARALRLQGGPVGGIRRRRDGIQQGETSSSEIFYSFDSHNRLFMLGKKKHICFLESSIDYGFNVLVHFLKRYFCF